MSEGTRSVQLNADAKTTLSFPLSAREGHSVAKVRVRVDGNGFKADRRYDLPVRAAWPQVLRSQVRTLDPLAAVSLDNSLTDGLMAESVNARLLVSPAANPVRQCTAGRAELSIWLCRADHQQGLRGADPDQATSSMLGADGLDAKTRRERMEGAFGRLASMQVANGNFSMWGDDGYVNPWLTPYITEFLLDAKDAGFAVPDNVLQKALNRLSEDLLSGGSQFYGQDDREKLKFANQAYSGYVLARSTVHRSVPCARCMTTSAARRSAACLWSIWAWRCHCRAMPSVARPRWRRPSPSPAASARRTSATTAARSAMTR